MRYRGPPVGYPPPRDLKAYPRFREAAPPPWRERPNPSSAGRGDFRGAPLGPLIANLQRHEPRGRLLDTAIERQGERPVYRVRWLTKDGRRVDYILDAETGAYLSGR